MISMPPTKLNQKQIKSNVITILKKYNPNGYHILNSTRPVEDMGIDSITIVQLISQLEAKFNIAIKDKEIIPAHFKTVEALIHFITRKYTDKE